MSIENARVQILIPVYNNVNELDKTMQSIWNQNFDKDNIYVVMVDFGSSDGSYEKMLKYPSNRLGVYQVVGDFCKSTMVSEVVKIAEYTSPGGAFFYRMVLWPGDIIYPTYIPKMVGAMLENLHINPYMIICETDIAGKNGKYFHKSLFEEKYVIDGKKDYIELNSKFFDHNIHSFGGNLAKNKHRTCGFMNERVWINKITISIYERNIVYIPERLACIKERLYIDELREILLRWESVIAFKRIQEAKYKKVLDKSFLKAPEMNLAEYALWRAYVCVKNNDYQMAKKCFMISEVIFPEIRSIGKFELTKQFLDGIDTKELDEIYMKDVIKC